MLHCTASNMDTYHVKDEQEFTTRVLGSKKPVVVDFFAKYGPRTYVHLYVWTLTHVCATLFGH